MPINQLGNDIYEISSRESVIKNKSYTMIGKKPTLGNIATSILEI